MTNTKTFGELSRDEKLELFAHWVDGGEVEVKNYFGKGWMKVNYPAWNNKDSHRKAQKKAVS